MSTHPIARFFRIALLLMLLVAVALTAAIITMHFAIHGAEVQVPALKSMTVADARSMTAGLGLNLDVDNRYYSGDVAAGHILSQSPVPGTVVRREWRCAFPRVLDRKKSTFQTPSVTKNAQPSWICAAPASRWAILRNCPTRGPRGNCPGSGSACARAGHRAAQRQPPGGRARR